uniref:Putative methylene-tetrahydrofolate dehydrogenase cyclohydrolase n=1 Tax=termite gut metagenome TaxID=433724 RepID=S0DDE6_9ZZZZ
MLMAIMIDGKAVSRRYRAGLKDEVTRLKTQGIIPGLAVVLVGNDSASQIYVKRKARACSTLGIYSEQYDLPADTGMDTLLALVDKLNGKDDIHGILVQLPLPPHLDEKAVITAISATKDVDAFHACNVGAIMIGDYNFVPCTPAGIITLIKSTGTEIAGKECVVIGRSNIVGKPMAMLLLHENGTVTICHSKTKNLADHCRRADILVSAAGKAGMITGDMIKPGAVVIDVGMNRDKNGTICGDVDFQSAGDVAGYLTPVPGGVGPMTITMLMQNTITAAKKIYGIV